MPPFGSHGVTHLRLERRSPSHAGYAGSRRHRQCWNLLLDALMRSCLVEVRHIRIEDALELLLVKDQQVVEAFLPHTPQEAFADCIGSWCVKGRFENLNRTRCRHASKAKPKFAIVIT